MSEMFCSVPANVQMGPDCRPLHFLMMCSRTAVPSVHSQEEQLVVWLCNSKMNIVHHIFMGQLVGF